MTTNYADIPTLPDALTDMWGDVFERKSSDELTWEDEEKEQNAKESEQAPSDVSPVTKPARKIIWPKRLETQPYYIYKYYIGIIRELVNDMGLDMNEKQMRQLAHNMWPKYSQRLNVAKEAAEHYQQFVKVKKEVFEFGDEPRLLRREIKTGTWGNILATSQENCNIHDINWQPYYIYKYFMDVVREQSRLMGLNHTKEDIRLMGERLWPGFSFKEFLIERALMHYRRSIKDKDNTETISDEETPNEPTNEQAPNEQMSNEQAPKEQMSNEQTSKEQTLNVQIPNVHFEEQTMKD